MFISWIVEWYYVRNYLSKLYNRTVEMNSNTNAITWRTATPFHLKHSKAAIQF